MAQATVTGWTFKLETPKRIIKETPRKTIGDTPTTYPPFSSLSLPFSPTKKKIFQKKKNLKPFTKTSLASLCPHSCFYSHPDLLETLSLFFFTQCMAMLPLKKKPTRCSYSLELLIVDLGGLRACIGWCSCSGRRPAGRIAD